MPLSGPSLFLGPGGAVFAKAEYFEDVAANLKSVTLFYAVFKLFNQAFVQVHAFTTNFANQVVVVFAGRYQLEAALAVSQGNRLHKPHPDQGFERSVNRGQTRGAIVLGTHQGMYILG